MRRMLFLAAVLPFFYAATVVLVLLSLYQRYDFIDRTTLIAAFTHAACWMVPLPLTFLAIDRIVRRGLNKRAAVAIALVCFASAFAGSVLFGVIVVKMNWYTRRDARQLGIDRGAISSALRMAPMTSQYPMVVTAAVLVTAAFLSTRREERDRELRASRVETRLAEARLELLRSQLNPHFLFNALNSVTALVRHDAAQARAMLGRLSDFYRIASETEGRGTIGIDEEIGFARQYLEIERVRFGARLTIDVNVDPDRGAMVPALILQPLVENAIKHGIGCTPGPGWVRVSVRRERGLAITIENNGRFSPGREGVGLANTRERLQHLYGGDHELRIEPAGAATRLTLRIPA